MQGKHIIPCGGLTAGDPVEDGAQVLPLITEAQAENKVVQLKTGGAGAVLVNA